MSARPTFDDVLQMTRRLWPVSNRVWWASLADGDHRAMGALSEATFRVANGLSHDLLSTSGSLDDLGVAVGLSHELWLATREERTALIEYAVTQSRSHDGRQS